MTKYLLVGAYPSKTENQGKSFCQELTWGFAEPIKILDCLFARPEDMWEELFETDKEFLQAGLPEKKLEIVLADPKKFIEQVRWADVIYFKGGRTRKLIDSLRESKGWEKELEGKTVAGTSAGVNFLARHYYSLDDLVICEGLGVLPIKALVHYKSDYNAPNIDWDKAYTQLEEYGDTSLPIYALKEGEYLIINQ